MGDIPVVRNSPYRDLFSLRWVQSLDEARAEGSFVVQIGVDHLFVAAAALAEEVVVGDFDFSGFGQVDCSGLDVAVWHVVFVQDVER